MAGIVWVKIALVGRGYSLSWGGAERVMVNLSRALKKAGHEVDIYAGRAEGIPGVKKISTPGVFSALKLLSFQRNARKILSGGRRDIVIGLCQFFPVDIYRAGGGVYAHWMRIRYPNAFVRAVKYMTSPVHLVMRWLEKKTVSPGNCGFIIANSMLVKGHLENYFNAGGDNIRVVYNGVDHDVFNPSVKRYREDTRKELGIGGDRIVALFVSNNWERKGLTTILNALCGEESITAVVLGRGKQNGFLKIMERLGIKKGSVIFAGTTERIEKFYGSSDFLVLPTQYDPCSNVCLEAMSSALPVITTKTNGASELIVHGKSGFILEGWDDHKKLREFFGKLKDGKTREEMGKSAYEAMRGFTWEHTMEETLKVCREAAAAKKRVSYGA